MQGINQKEKEKMTKGWYNHSKEHDLARQGIKTAQRIPTALQRPQQNTSQRRQSKTRKVIEEISKTDPLFFNKETMTVFHLPIETAVYIPSTRNESEQLNPDEFAKRVKESHDTLTKMFGGFSSMEITGGFTEKGKVIKENVVKITVFTDAKNLRKRKAQLREWLLEKQQEWGQDSLGYEVEGDLYYISAKKKGQ